MALMLARKIPSKWLNEAKVFCKSHGSNLQNDLQTVLWWEGHDQKAKIYHLKGRIFDRWDNLWSNDCESKRGLDTSTSNMRTKSWCGSSVVTKRIGQKHARTYSKLSVHLFFWRCFHWFCNSGNRFCQDYLIFKNKRLRGSVAQRSWYPIRIKLWAWFDKLLQSKYPRRNLEIQWVTLLVDFLKKRCQTQFRSWCAKKLHACSFAAMFSKSEI